MRFHVVINPSGASGATLQLWEKDKPLFSNHEVMVYQSTLEDSIEEICRRLTTDLKESTNIVIVGGDGSINEAINGIQDFEHTRFAFIPCGSGNDLAKSLDLEIKAEEIVKRICLGEVRRTHDLGEIVFHQEVNQMNPITFELDPTVVNRDYTRKFINGTGLGFDATVCYYVAKSKAEKVLNKINLGKFIYLIEALRVILSAQRFLVEVTYSNGKKAYQNCLFVDGMNHLYQGGGFKFCPDASPTDGYIDFCIANNVSNIDFYRMFPSAYEGKHVTFKGVSIERDKEVRIQSEIPMWIQTDGEIHSQSNDVTIRIAKEKIQLLV